MKVTFIIAAVSLLSACQLQQQQPAYVMYPVDECGYVNEPVYGLVNRPTSDGEVLLGAVLGGALGKGLTDNNGVAVFGAVLGGSIAHQNRVTERAVIGANRVYKCQTVYR